MENLEGIADPRERRDAEIERRRRHEEETREGIRKRERKIEQLVEKRLELRMAASDAAGSIGLQYDAESNNFIRVVRRFEEGAPEPPVVPRPEPLAYAEELGTAGSGNQARRLNLKAIGILLWVFLLAIGPFIGIGLLTIAGFSWNKYPWALWAGGVLGVCVLGGLKVLVGTAWGRFGRNVGLGNPIWPGVLVPAALTGLGCALDAHLGAIALREYLMAREFTAASVPPYFQLFVVSLAVTAPLLMATAAKEFVDESHGVTAEDIAAKAALDTGSLRKADLERREKHRVAEYEDKVAAVAEQQSRNRELDAEREREWEGMKGNAEFRCLQGLISQIGVLSVQIEELDKELTRYRIAAGYKSSQLAAGRRTQGRQEPPWVENHVAGEAAELAASTPPNPDDGTDDRGAYAY